MAEITEESILPDGWIQDHLRYNSDWRRQYQSFGKTVRDAAAQRLYDALSEKQRTELKTLGRVTFKCAAGHTIRVTPEYSSTTSVGCYSIGNGVSQRERGASLDSIAHMPTTIGDFLLTLKLYFTLACICEKSHYQVVDVYKKLLE